MEGPIISQSPSETHDCECGWPNYGRERNPLSSINPTVPIALKRDFKQLCAGLGACKCFHCHTDIRGHDHSEKRKACRNQELMVLKLTVTRNFKLLIDIFLTSFLESY